MIDFDFEFAKQQALDEIGKLIGRAEKTKNMISESRNIQELMLSMLTNPITEHALNNERGR